MLFDMMLIYTAKFLVRTYLNAFQPFLLFWCNYRLFYIVFIFYIMSYLYCLSEIVSNFVSLNLFLSQTHQISSGKKMLRLKTNISKKIVIIK